MRQELQQWFNENEPDETLIYKKGLWKQVKFVRDMIPQLIFSSYEKAEEHKCVVISTHVSKSVILPVYQITLANNIIITMRCNFYDWKNSISSVKDIEMDIMGLFNPDRTISPCYFEGFPNELIYGSYVNNQNQFSIELGDQFQVYTFFWIFGSKMGLRSK